MVRHEEPSVLRGPTIAFKDMALSILPHLMIAAARKNKVKNEIVILTATSADKQRTVGIYVITYLRNQSADIDGVRRGELEALSLLPVHGHPDFQQLRAAGLPLCRK